MQPRKFFDDNDGDRNLLVSFSISNYVDMNGA